MKNLVTLVLLALALVFPARAHAVGGANSPPSASELSVPRVSDGPRQSSRGSRGEDQRYAAREKASPDAKKFRGGDAIVISATAAIIILLGVIILILIL